MSTHTIAPKVSKLEVIQTGSRRRWSVAEKLRIVAESTSVPNNVAATARRNGLSSGQLSDWRKQVREGKLALSVDEAGFVPVHLAPDVPINQAASGALEQLGYKPVSGGCSSGRIEIGLLNGIRVVVGPDVDASALRRVLKALERR